VYRETTANSAIKEWSLSFFRSTSKLIVFQLSTKTLNRHR